LKKLIETIQRVGIVANSTKIKSRNLVRRAAKFIEQSGRTVLCDEATATLADLALETAPDVTALTQQVDLLLVFGGDGTMLRVARDMHGSPTPVLGINVGGLGFLTEVTSTHLSEALEEVWQGHFRLEARALLEAAGTSDGKKIEVCALNDVVISRAIPSRLIELEVRVDSEILTRYRCDGLIVSSPTGSTAYSLAAGGAIVCPTAHVFTLTPICPHTLSNRSIIVGLDSTIEAKVLSQKPATVLSADGQSISPLLAGDIITVRRSRYSVRLVHLVGTSFFETLRRKLHWSGSHVAAPEQKRLSSGD
jgi:NAD+ kinase